MARTKDVVGQEILIDNETPEIKAMIRQIKVYEKLKAGIKEQHAADHEAEEKARDKVLRCAQASGLTPDAQGAYRLTFDEKEWVIFQDSQLKIKKHKIKYDGVGEYEDTDDEE
jgi:hypothetical protein